MIVKIEQSLRILVMSQKNKRTKFKSEIKGKREEYGKMGEKG